MIHVTPTRSPTLFPNISAHLPRWCPSSSAWDLALFTTVSVVRRNRLDPYIAVGAPPHLPMSYLEILPFFINTYSYIPDPFTVYLMVFCYLPLLRDCRQTSIHKTLLVNASANIHNNDATIGVVRVSNICLNLSTLDQSTIVPNLQNSHFILNIILRSH